jgi:hypothetical protein
MPLEPPENAGYMIAAYVVAPVILAGYLASLWGRVRKAVGRSAGPAVGGSGGQAVGRSGGRAGK